MLKEVQTPSLCLNPITKIELLMSGLKNKFRYAKLTICLFFIFFSNYKRRCRLAKNKHEHDNKQCSYETTDKLKKTERTNKRNGQISIQITLSHEEVCRVSENF